MTSQVAGNVPCCKDSEQHIILRRSWRSVIVPVLTAFALSGAVLVISAMFSVRGLPVPLSHLLTEGEPIRLPLYLLVLLVMLARPLVSRFDARHEFGCHHVRSTTGLCSLRRRDVEIPYEEFLGVRSSQSLLGRLLGYGDVLVWTASSDHSEIRMQGIEGVDRLTRTMGGKIDHVATRRRANEK